MKRMLRSACVAIVMSFCPSAPIAMAAGLKPPDGAPDYQADPRPEDGANLALTVEKIRWDHPEATVLDAYQVFEDIFEQKEVSSATDQVNVQWSGEWSRFTE